MSLIRRCFPVQVNCRGYGNQRPQDRLRLGGIGKTAILRGWQGATLSLVPQILPLLCVTSLKFSTAGGIHRFAKTLKSTVVTRHLPPVNELQIRLEHDVRNKSSQLG